MNVNRGRVAPKSSANVGFFHKMTKKQSEKPLNPWSVYIKSLILHAVCASKENNNQK